ncbi:MAG: transporter permease [Microbacteriaceae bacterium]|jgi:NitT/TauT family transport system permease protein|nr:transporter permease [Microbacteriaceae bacterium]
MSLSTEHIPATAEGQLSPRPTPRRVPKKQAVTARGRRIRRRIWSIVPVFTFVGIILLWAIIVWAFNIPQYLLPSPVAVFKELVTSWGLIWDNTLTTLLEIALGFVIAIVIAIPLGLLIALSMPARQILYPPVVVLQLVPKIAIAPLFIIWLGLGIDSKVLLTVLMSFFPLLISSISGFQILDTRLLYLTRSMGASQWETFRFLRFPAALPVIFAGLKTSATIAVTAALVAEFVGSTKGLGYLLLQATNTLNVPQVFAVLVVLTVIGIVLNYLVEFAEWLLTPWQRVKYN